MANCAISERSSNRINYFIRDCIQAGRNFRGSNGSVTGIKESLFDVKWTEDIVSPIFDDQGHQVGWDRSVSDLGEAIRYQGRVVSSRADVDAVTRELIAARYPASEETKILRLKLAGDASTWEDYQTYVEGLVQAGREFKDKHFVKEE